MNSIPFSHIDCHKKVKYVTTKITNSNTFEYFENTVELCGKNRATRSFIFRDN